MMIIAAVIATPALGYIDPASGSALMSAIIGAFVAIGLAVKGYWYKLKGFFSPSKSTATGAAAVDAKEPTEE